MERCVFPRPTFNGMTRDNLSYYENESEGKSVAIVGVPMELGSDERGLREAPRYLLEHGLENVIASIGAEVTDITMIPCRNPERVVSAGSLKYLDEIIAASRVSSVVVERAVRRGDFILALGGDHSIALGTIAGAATALEHRKLGVIWIDAHPDANTDASTLSGNIHGMPAASLMGFGHPLLTGAGKEKRYSVLPEHFLYLGLKDIDKAEIEYLRRESISAVTMLDIAKHGLTCALRAIDTLRRKVDVVWVSMDMDSIDKEFAPGVGMPTDGGLTRREVSALAQYIGHTCQLSGVDVVEIHPAKDEKEKTVTLAFELIARFLGGQYSWYEKYMDDYRHTNISNASNDRAKVRRNK